MTDIKPGSYIDVRMIAVAVDGADVIARLPSKSALHQFRIGAHQVQNTAPRSPDAIAADVVCSSYDGLVPLQDRRARTLRR